MLAATAIAPARQQQALPAWQVTGYDITVSAPGAAGGERAISARARIDARNVGAGAGRTMTLRINPDAKEVSATVGGASARVRQGSEARTKLQTAQVALPSAVEPGGSVSVTVEYRLPVAENTGLAAVSPEGLQFLPLSFWYPTPNTPVAPRGADYAPFRLTVQGAAGGETVVSSGKAAQGGAGFEQTLNAQPFFLTGRWEQAEGSGDARGVSAWLRAGAGEDERKQAEALINLAAAARAFYAGLLGPAPDAPLRLVGVRRGAGFDMAGTVLLDHAVFRRPKVDSVTALHIADAVARLWVGGAAGVQGEGAGAVREGLPRLLATLFIEKQFGKTAADEERMKMALLYASVARKDAPLSQISPAFDTYFNSASNKGALVWRILMDAIGRERFAAVLRAEFSPGREVTLASLRNRLAEAGGERVVSLLPALFDKPTDTDFLVGLPQQRGGGWASTLRNTGSFDVEVTVLALTERGQRLTTTARIPAKDFGEARFQTAERITRVEIDPEKLYPQLDYSNDIMPQSPGTAETAEQARAQLAQQPARAEEAAREILRRTPSNEEARVVLARALLEQSKLDEAEREFRTALESPLPSPATLAWANVGFAEIAMRRQRAAEAARLFDLAAKIEAEYASTFAARAGRIRAETAAGSAPAVDEQLKTAVTQLDAAIRSGRKADIDAAIVPGELLSFSKGLIGTQPEIWQTRVLRTEQVAPDRVAADVTLTVRTLGRDMQGPALFVFARTPAGWKLSEIPVFEVR
ncbi:MAG TPA: tetratricopeptide repeat protein [Pyrinomonadaceae bacterium]|nr:tetratricopeptide repeat protein [Pyrinomonadaceae bacterium]